MAKYQLPQFIETEINIVGPFTLKQFLWIAAGGALLFVLFVLVHGVFFFVLAVPLAALFLALAFVKVNDMPLINYIAFMLSYTLNPKKYIYKNEPPRDIQLPTEQNKNN